MAEAPHNPALLRFGQLLRKLRNAKGFSGVKVHELTGISQPQISKIETGKAGLPDWRDIRRILVAINASEEETTMLRLQFELAQLDPSSYSSIAAGGASAKQLQLRDLEASATLIRSFQLGLIPGLLQTAQYATEKFRELGYSDLEAVAGAEQRYIRQAILRDPRRQFEFVMHESALYRERDHDGADGVMEGQLQYLESQMIVPNIDIRVLATHNGLPAGANSPFLIIDRRYVSSETAVRELTATTRAEIDQYVSVFNNVKAVAYSGELALQLIRTALSAAIGAH